MPDMTAPVAPFCGSCGDSCEPVKTVAAAVGFMISDGGEADDGAAAQDENSAIDVYKRQVLKRNNIRLIGGIHEIDTNIKVKENCLLYTSRCV